MNRHRRTNRMSHDTRVVLPTPSHGARALGHVSMLALVGAVGLTSLAGCVRRTMTITTDPPNALVFVNDQEVGRSTVATDFLWYGDYDVIVRKEGYETLKTNWPIKPPWYQIMPLDFFFEVLWPGQLHDQRAHHFTLVAQQIPSEEELVERAGQLRDRALEAGK